MSGFIRTRREHAKPIGQSTFLEKFSREAVRRNPFLGLTGMTSPKLRPVCPGYRRGLISPTAHDFDGFKPMQRQISTGNIRLKPISLVRTPQMHSAKDLKGRSPCSPRPIRTPSFSEEITNLPSIKCKTIVLKRYVPSLSRPSSLKSLGKSEMNYSFGKQNLKRAMML